jgi:protein-disulfide isomerase
MGTVYANQSSLNNDYIYSVADSLGLNRTTFDECLDSEKYRDKILSHLAEGSRMGLRGTPSIYMDGQLIQWAGPEVMKEYLESL